MDTAVIQQFLNFFQDYINLCQLENWPENDTTEAELRNAFIISQHVEKCLDRLLKKNVINDFLSVLDSYDNTPNSLFKNCLSDPPKYILKKIINSNTKINQIDVGFRLFLALFSEEKLENCLTDLMLEAASKETLLKNVTCNVTRDKILEFKSKVLMLELNSCQSDITNLLNNCNLDMVELLVVCLLNSEPKYNNAVSIIANGFLNIIVSKDDTLKKFLKLLFKVDNKYFIEMCIEHSDIFTYIVKCLVDCGKLLREGMSAEYFYIDLNNSELASIVQRICSNESLNSEFFNIVNDCDSDLTYWQNIL